MVSNILGAIFAAVAAITSLFGAPPQIVPSSIPPLSSLGEQQSAPFAASNQKSQEATSGQTQAAPQSSASTSHAQNQSPSSSGSGASTYGHIYTDSELLAMAGSVDLTALPLGDNKYTTSGAKKGYVYVCHVMQGG